MGIYLIISRGERKKKIDYNSHQDSFEPLSMSRIFIFLTIFLCALTAAAETTSPKPGSVVFQLHSQHTNAQHVRLIWTIQPGYFLYREHIHINTPTPQIIRIQPFTYPEPQIKMSPGGKTTLIYREQVQIDIPIQRLSKGEGQLTVQYQGCSDQGFCYPPTTQVISLTSKQGQQRDHAPSSSLNNIEQLFASNHLFFIFAAFFGFGILLSFTPCILPMVPVLSGMIVGHGHTITTKKAFGLSLCYVLCMSITYSLIGGVIALLGQNLQVYMQSPIAIIGFSSLFVLLALSMFGFFELRLPNAFQNKLAQFTRNESGGHYLQAAIMGCLSILILSPCATPPLLGVLSYIANKGSLVLGMLALFFLGVGMGTPLLLVGASAGRLLPKAGAWMNEVKHFFGILMLCVAIHLLSRVLSGFCIMLLWAILFIMTGIACKPFITAPGRYAKSKQGFGLIALVYGLFILYGASAGHTDPLHPLQTNDQSTSPSPINAIHITQLDAVLQQLNEAKIKQLPAILDFTASWCESCQTLAHRTLKDTRILKAAQKVMWIDVDLSENSEESQKIMQHFGVIAPPTFLFYNRFGTKIPELTLVGGISTSALLTQMTDLTE